MLASRVRRCGLAALALAGLVFVGLSGSTPAAAQRSGYSSGPGPSPYGGPPSGRHTPGRFDYYTLSLSWSPTYCAGSRRAGYDAQCDRRSGRPYAFVLHGLWPQFERGGAPDSCPYTGRIPQATIDRMLDIMPSGGLIVHEYRKHGSCSGLEPNAYFALSRKLHDKVAIPARFQNLERAQTVSPGDLVRDFVAANPGLRPDMLAVTCGSPGDRLREVRVCFDRAGEFTRCGSNENQGRLCRSSRMYVPPVRGGSSSARDAEPPRGPSREMLPIPR